LVPFAVLPYVISATMVNTDFTVAGSVTVSAISNGSLVETATGATFGAIALGVSITVAFLSPTVTASLTFAGNVSAGTGVTVTANSPDRAIATAVSGAGGIIAGGGAIPRTNQTSDTKADIDANTHITTLRATQQATSMGRTLPVSGGAVGSLFQIVPTPDIFV